MAGSIGSAASLRPALDAAHHRLQEACPTLEVGRGIPAVRSQLGIAGRVPYSASVFLDSAASPAPTQGICPTLDINSRSGLEGA
jgi:hypothetical protein